MKRNTPQVKMCRSVTEPGVAANLSIALCHTRPQGGVANASHGQDDTAVAMKTPEHVASVPLGQHSNHVRWWQRPLWPHTQIALIISCVLYIHAINTYEYLLLFFYWLLQCNALFLLVLGMPN